MLRAGQTNRKGASVRTSATAAKYLRLHLADNVGPLTLNRLLEHFGGVDAVLEASEAALQQVAGIGTGTAREIFRKCRSDDADRQIERAERAGIRIICREDEMYPRLLRQIPDPPVCLYVRGQLLPEDDFAVAVVGSRRSTTYGQEQARRFGYLLAQNGLTVVSGMAMGIDSCAHRGALSAGGRTVAVLGSGLLNVYPPRNRDLLEQIVESGAAISELPLDASPDASNFPRRNRIIAGMSYGVLVVEGHSRSGSLITARYAAEYDREVFAIPGRIDVPNHDGPNRLIRDQHAKLVMSLEDILEELHFGDALKPHLRPDPAQPQPRPVGNLSPAERAICSVLGPEAISLDQVCELTGLSAAEAASSLTMLQLKGVVRRVPGNLFVAVIREAGGAGS